MAGVGEQICLSSCASPLGLTSADTPSKQTRQTRHPYQAPAVDLASFPPSTTPMSAAGFLDASSCQVLGTAGSGLGQGGKTWQWM